MVDNFNFFFYIVAGLRYLKEVCMRILWITLCSVGLAASLAAGDFTYIGAKKCMMCHKGPSHHNVWEKWEASKHTVAFKALNPAKGEDKNPECLACHTTGFKSGGYEIGGATASQFEGVQCEACHGPGSAYKALSIMKDRQQAIANGLLIPDEKTCLACHNKKSPTFKDFNYAEALKKIDHSYPK